jgi:hypothetical protein
MTFRPDATNPYLVTALHIALVEQRWSFARLVRVMRWKRHPEWLAGVTRLAGELGLIEAGRRDG